MTQTILPARLALRRSLDDTAELLALRAALTAAHLLGLATGVHLRKLRSNNDPLTELQARLEEANLRARLAWEAADILATRFAKVPERHRPHYTPAARFRILEIRGFLGWNAHEAARAFLVCPNTVLNWERAADPENANVGSTVKPTPPLRRAADVVRSTVQTMTRLGLGGQDLVARVLAHAGWRLSARSVERYRRERPLTPSPSPPVPRSPRPVVARFVHHVWMMDVSQVKQFLGPDLHLAAVFDAFSRTPLAVQVFEAKPGAKDMAQILKRAARAFGVSRYVITDKGGEFVGGAFRKAVKRLGAVQRFAASDSIYATARLERFWRTLKELAGLYCLHLPLTAEDLERRLELALLHYACFRPHEGLRGATPAEAFLEMEPMHLAAVDPPRGRPGEGSGRSPFEVAYLDPAGRRFPILKPAA